MDFKSHSEFVLPPQKGVKRAKKGSKAKAPTGLPQPREYRQRAKLSKLSNDPELEQRERARARDREPRRQEEAPDTQTTALPEPELYPDYEEDRSTVEALVASALDSSKAPGARDDDDRDDGDGEVEPPMVLLDDLPDADAGAPEEATDPRPPKAEVDTVAVANRAREDTRRDARVARTPVAVRGARALAGDEAAREIEKESMNIVEDENVIRALSSVVEKLDRMEDQLKQGMVDPGKPPRSIEAGARNRPDQRDFIIAYDDEFVGHFRTEKRISNKKAFQKAATALREKVSDFDPRRLHLYRPVLVKIENPETIPYVDGESFNWFGSARVEA